jgi:predicted nucleotidyltransferase component of viral defense system
MNNSAQAVKDKLKNVVKEKNIEFNSAMRFYMYDRFIERLSKSKYKDNFILKGGFYLSTLFGIDNRSTMDIDTAINNANLDEFTILKMINEIINIDLDDNVIYKINRISPIRDEDEYGGLRVTIDFNLDNIRDSFHIDVATGDPIYPGPKDYGYKSIISGRTYKVWAYSIETVLAEKIETIFSKLAISSRAKDYYDIYLINKLYFKKLNKDDFRKAINKTFKKRNFNSDLIKCLDIIRDNKVLKQNWISYSRKNYYARNIKYEDTIKCLEQFVEILVAIEI